MQLKATIDLKRIREVVAEHLSEKYGFKVDPMTLEYDEQGDYDTKTFAGFKFDVDPELLRGKTL
jgi:hypothetical protein